MKAINLNSAISVTISTISGRDTIYLLERHPELIIREYSHFYKLLRQLIQFNGKGKMPQF